MTSPTISRSDSRANRFWIILLVALALLSFLAMRRGMGKAMRMQADTTAANSSSQLKPGDEAKVVLEITSVTPAANIEGHVLEKQSETVYHRTPNTLKILFDATTPIVMGKASDINQGAVVHITAKMAADHALHAGQIVILTGYVKVQ
jgi:hypothetical protein